MAPKRKPRSELCKSAKYFRDHPEARKKKDATSKKVNARPGQKAKRRDLGKKNSAADKRGVNRKGKDLSHTSFCINQYRGSKSLKEIECKIEVDHLTKRMREGYFVSKKQLSFKKKK